MSAPAPLWMSLQGPWRRVLYVALYEGIAIAVVTLAFAMLLPDASQTSPQQAKPEAA